MRLILSLLRIVIFIASIIMTLAVCISSIGSIAIWLFLTFGARDVSINGIRGGLPSKLNGLVFHQSDSTRYLVGSLLLLFVILPLSLALMEKFYFGLYPESLELEGEEMENAPSDGDAIEARQAGESLQGDPKIESVRAEPPPFWLKPPL